MITWPQNDTYTALSLTLQSSDGTPLNLTGLSASAITVSLRPVTPLGVSTPCTGTAAIITANSGVITYTFGSADVATPGNYYLEISVAFTGGTWPAFPQLFQIERTG